MSRIARSVLVVLTTAWFLAGCGSSKQSAITNDPNTVATVANQAVSLSDFESRYSRTVGGRAAASDDSIGAYRDFLNRLVDYRMKLLAGKEAGLFQSPDIQSELASYRINFARPYLIDGEVNEPIMTEYFERMKTAVDASHILITVPPDAPPTDTLQAYLQIRRIADSLKTGADFGELALRNSKDPSARNQGGPGYKGRLGFFTRGMMVEPFEDQAYQTPVGQVSPIFRTQFGYHILKVNDRKPAVPEIRVAHIMVIPASGSKEDSLKAVEKINLVRQKLAAGQDFATVAREYSDHQQTAQRGGELGVLSYYAMQVPEKFKEVSFSIKNVGDVSEPFQTQFGYHIVKLLWRRDLSSMQANYDDLKQFVSQLPRQHAAERAYGAKVRQQIGFSIDTAAVKQVFSGMSQDSMYQFLFSLKTAPEVAGRQIARLGDSVLTVQDMKNHIAEGHNPRNNVSPVDLVSDFVSQKAISFEAAKLEERDPEFKRIMEEFQEGLVLFKVMEDSVWNVAQRDSVGLKQYYDANASKYRFPERIRVIAFHAANDSLLNQVKSRFVGGAPVSDVLSFVRQDTSGQVRVDTISVEEKTRTELDVVFGLGDGKMAGPITVNRRRVLVYRDQVEPPRQKTFEEARSEALSDYQQVIEQRFLDRLRNRYNPHLYPERLNGAFAGDRPSGSQASALPASGN